MNVMNDIAEARARALSLRASAQVCGSEQGPLKFRLVRAADQLNAMVRLAVRGIARIEELEQLLAMFEQRMRKAVDHQHAAFEHRGEVDGGELLAWFADWREEAQTAIHQLAKARSQGQVQS